MTRKLFQMQGYKEEGVSWPSYLVLKRGSGGLFKTRIEDCKTLLTVSVKQQADQIFVLCEYDVKVLGGVITAGDRAVLENEVEKLKSDLFSAAPAQTVSQVDVLNEASPRRCEMCGSLIPVNATFCGSCGRAVKPTPISINLRGQEIIKRGIEVRFEPDRIRTGCPNLDLLLYGGLPDGYATILTAPSSEERDLLVTRFTEAGLQDDEVTFYVCSEMSRMIPLVNEHPKLCYAFVCNPQADLVAPEAPNIFKIRAVDRLTELNVALSSAINSLSKDRAKPRRLILNNVSDVLLSCGAQTARRWLMELSPKLKAQGFTILTILNPYMHAREDTQAIVDLFDGHIEVYEKEEAGQAGMHIRVRKMYNQRYSSKEIPITKDDFHAMVKGAP